MGTRQQAKLPRVGVIANGSPDSLFEAVRQSFAQHGYVEGRNIVIEARFAEGHLDRVPEFIAEFVGLNVDIIVSLGAVGPAAAQKANTRLPVVFVAVIDPVAVGLAATMERPGGNITGITTFDPQQATKQLELLKQVVPNLARLAILSDEDIPRAEGWNPLEKTNDTAARALGLRPQWLKIKGPIPDLEGAFTAMRNERAEALLVLDVPIPIIHQKQIAELAATYRLPTMFLGGRRMSEAGGLIAYGAGLLDTLQRIPVYVEKILGGAKPGDLPIEVLKQPILIFNLKAARTIGITIPPELLKRADQVVE
ncbi:MAG TPA: ABC transporter substrate-binding protein [Sphingomicrobium sp.]|nr:ABC transporter substrate-binding protein [Sphingomicrobium sp.]